MIEALRRWLQARDASRPVERIDTHISFVLVTHDRAYKLHKAVDLGFLDFTTRDRRQHDCLEELRLNRRLAPDLYLHVRPVTGTPDAPQIDGPGAPIDWVLCMRAFDQSGLWDRLAARGELRRADIDALAALLHTFHRNAAIADPHGRFGQPIQVRQPVLDTLRTLDARLATADDRRRLQALRTWEASAFERLHPTLAQRRRAGRVRECHGDLHLGNVAQIDGRTTAFDCLEFSEDLRWIDVMSELAFMAMDLQHHGRADLAHRFINACLERSGDYAGVRVLRYYLVYRALVRAKVAALRQAGSDTVRSYLDLALRCSRPTRPALMITHGVSGSGKTTLTGSLVEACGALRIRADVERKRLFGLDALAHSGSAPDVGLYSRAATAATYSRLLELAAEVLAGGCSVVLDATFSQRWQRDQARQWALDNGVRCAILDFDATPEVLRERVRQRAERGDDASEADLRVLEAQLRTADPLGADEQTATFGCGPTRIDADAEISADWSALLAWLAHEQVTAA
jgi:aminoglycoside phosphotransferase family enzyme/predicted kinase